MTLKGDFYERTFENYNYLLKYVTIFGSLSYNRSIYSLN